MGALSRRILAAPKHVVGHLFGLVSVVLMLSLLVDAAAGWTGLDLDEDDGSLAAVLGAAGFWLLHLMLARLDLEDDPSWFAAGLRGMAWAARCGALIFVPATVALWSIVGVEWLAGDAARQLADHLAWAPAAFDREARVATSAFVCVATAVVLLGVLIEWLYTWSLVSLMSRTSRPTETAAATADTLRRRRAARRGLRRRTFRADHPSPTSPAARALLARNRAFRRWVRADTLVPFGAMLAVVVANGPEIAAEQDDGSLDVLTTVAVLWGLGALAKFLRLGERTPFRQARLVYGTAFAMLGAAIAGVLGLLAPLGLVGASRSRHWALVERLVGVLETLIASRHTFAVLALAVLCEPLDAEPRIAGLERPLALFLLGLSAYVGAFVVLRAARRLWMRRLPPVHLVLLRVFGDTDRARFLVRRIAPSWHGIGNVAFIGASDTAVYTLDIRAMAGVFFGQLRDRFIKGWEERDAAIEQHLGDRHAGSSHDFFCFDDTWKPMLRQLLAADAVVLMDLRGFSSQNAGCVFELENLVERVPLHRVVLLVDGSTDRGFLDATLARAWSARSRTSPNAGHDAGEVSVFDCDGDGDMPRTATRLVERMAEAAAVPRRG